MNVKREVILDLLPVYLAGEASAATRALVEEYMKADEEIARLIRDHQSEKSPVSHRRRFRRISRCGRSARRGG